MSIFSKSRDVDDSKKRTEMAVSEVSKILNKYNCAIDIRHNIVIVPLKDKNEVDDSKEKNKRPDSLRT